MGVGNILSERKEFIVCVLIAIWVGVAVIADEATGIYPECPPDEFYKVCIDNCSDCEFRGKCPIIECKQSGCDCRPNFVRLTPGGPCEPVRKCPKPPCGENEVYRPCGPICESCARLRCRILSCEYRCYCKEGYLRKEGKCIPADDCPPRSRCSIGEESGESGLVDEYCIHEEGVKPSNDTEKKERCYCMEGYKRNLMGHCSDEFFCEFNKCRNIEKYQSCPPKCNSTCSNYGDPNCEEDGQCYPGCFCPEGHVMNDHRVCVRVEECPPGSNPLAPTAAPTTLGSTGRPVDDATTPMKSLSTSPTEDQSTSTDSTTESMETSPGISTKLISSTTPELISSTTREPILSTTRKPKARKPNGTQPPKKDDKVDEKMENPKELTLVTPDFEEQNV